MFNWSQILAPKCFRDISISAGYLIPDSADFFTLVSSASSISEMLENFNMQFSLKEN